MKKEIIMLIILSGLILLFVFLNLTKAAKIIEPVNNNNSNPYSKYTFYKEENYNRYLKYDNSNDFDLKNVVLRVNIGLDNSFYTSTKEINSFHSLMIVNKYNYVSKSFKPNNLVLVEEFSIENMYLEENCKNAFVKMAADAKTLGYNLRAMSTYRTYEYQENLYNKYVSNDGVSEADTYSARPGFSEHHTGLAIDIDNIKTSYLNFESTKEFNWLQENAHKYGFILRYPKGREDITGYMYEPWHYRYIGVEIATYIKENNLTYEEYYYEFLDK